MKKKASPYQPSLRVSYLWISTQLSTTSIARRASSVVASIKCQGLTSTPACLVVLLRGIAASSKAYSPLTRISKGQSTEVSKDRLARAPYCQV